MAFPAMESREPPNICPIATASLSQRSWEMEG